MELLVRSLVFLGTLALPGTWAGSHSLRFFLTSVTRPGLGDPRFFAVGYVDDHLFGDFYSDREGQRAEPRVPWSEAMEREEPGYTEDKTVEARRWTQRFRVTLETLRGYFNQSAGGVHTLQRMIGCEVTPELGFRRGFLQFAYDGQDYIALDTETSTWTAASPPAVNTKHEWEADGSAEKEKIYLEGRCVIELKKHLKVGKETLLRTDPPSVRMIRHAAPHGEVTLRCLAQDFYPADISLTWLRDGQELLQDMEFIETRPAGDGTFQKWAAVGVTPGEEREYTCRVQHEGLPEPLTLRWEPPSSSTWWYIVGGIAAGLLVVIAGLWYWRKKNSGGKGGDYVPAAGNGSVQGSDVSLTAKA